MKLGKSVSIPILDSTNTIWDSVWEKTIVSVNRPIWNLVNNSIDRPVFDSTGNSVCIIVFDSIEEQNI